MCKWLIFASTLWCSAGEGVLSAQGNFVARVGPSGEFLELEHEYLPLHHIGNVRYFSAGVGLEERRVEYPPFSLKLVFTAGGKPYLTGVDVAIRNLKGETVTIPGEQIEGPWLFVDLPSGTYDITATHGSHKRSLQDLKIVAGTQKTLYLRWADEDTSAAPKLPPE